MNIKFYINIPQNGGNYLKLNCKAPLNNKFYINLKNLKEHNLKVPKEPPLINNRFNLYMEAITRS